VLKNDPAKLPMV